MQCKYILEFVTRTHKLYFPKQLHQRRHYSNRLLLYLTHKIFPLTFIPQGDIISIYQEEW